MSETEPQFGENRYSEEQLRRIRFLLTDVDGVLTDGGLIYDHEGRESKRFHVHDGAAFAYWRSAGLQAGLLSGRNCAAVAHRAKGMKIQEIHLGHLDKEPVLEDIANRLDLSMDEILYIGDDLLDLPILRRVGFSVSVPNGRREVRDAVHFVTETPGGSGAVREVVELVLKAKGVWDDVVARDGRA